MELGKFNKKMAEAISLTDEALTDLGAQRLFVNRDFIVNEDLTLENYLQFELKRDSRHARIVLIISAGDIRVDIDKAEEISEWSLTKIQSDRGSFLSFLKNLLTSYILVEHYGTSVMRISLFNSEGKCIDVFKYRRGLGLKGEREDRLYFPIYVQ